MQSSKNIVKSVISALITVTLVFEITAQNSCLSIRKEKGVCVPALKCETVNQILKVAGKPLPSSVVDVLKSLHCGVFNNMHYLCCEPNRVIGEEATVRSLSLPKDQQSQTATGGASVIKSVIKTDAEIRSGMSILEASKCGKSGTDKIANGENAKLAEFPWMALLVYFNGASKTLDCGGSLITDRHVLTAAHCIRIPKSKKLVSVRLGEHNTKTDIDCVPDGEGEKCSPPVQEIDVEVAIYHKDYDPAKFSNDIGLIRLVRKVTRTLSVRPVCLPITPSSKSPTLKELTIAGWGKIEDQSQANVLQKAQIPIKLNDDCQAVYKVIKITDSQICAGGENNVDTCKGDSGGPLFLTTKYRRGPRYIQYGVISGGSMQCGRGFPGIYLKVEKYLPWIAGHIEE